MRLYDLVENTLHHDFVKATTCYNIEMASEPWRNRILTATGRTHSSEEDNIRDLLQLITLVGVVVPRLLSMRLARLCVKLNGWLPLDRA